MSHLRHAVSEAKGCGLTLTDWAHGSSCKIPVCELLHARSKDGKDQWNLRTTHMQVEREREREREKDKA